MKDILLLSYYDLPYHLKTCLLYLYPEDDEIQTQELIWRWIAEGFIAEERGQTVDQVAESYFNELVNRNLVQPIDIQYDGRVKHFKVHDMVLELIVSLSNEENFASIVEGQSYNGSDHKIRRLRVHSEHVGDEVTQKIIDKWSQVRSISFYGLQEQRIYHLQELHHLRVLVFHHNGIHHLGNQHIKYIGCLFQLNFLAIHPYSVTELPEDIGNLRYLQTLDIHGSGIRKLPPSIGHLQKLVHLLVGEGVELPHEIGGLLALQELSDARISSIKLVEALRGLTKLKTLYMYMPSRYELGRDIGRYEEALNSSLAVMGNHGLQSLGIYDYNDLLREEQFGLLCSTSTPCLWKLDICGKGIARFPKQVASLVNLTHLKLGFHRIQQEDLCIIGGIPALLFCMLIVGHSPDERLTVSSQQFGRLKEFRYYIWHDGGGLEMLFLQEAMPELRRLELQFRAQETESKMGFEFSFDHLASLEHIKVVIWTKGATRSSVEAAEAAVRNAVSIHPGHPTLELHGGLEVYNEREERRRRQVLVCCWVLG
jgi:Leucine-rich repeat (LRR) protein